MKVIDPTHNEEAVMAGRMIATINANGDICAIQKAGGEGAAVETYNSERSLQKIKHEPTCVATKVKEGQDQTLDNEGIDELVGKYMERLKLISRESYASQNINDEVEVEPKSLRRGADSNGIKFSSAPLSWDPYSKGVDPEFLKASVASQGLSTGNKKKESNGDEKPETPGPFEDVNPNLSAVGASRNEMQVMGLKTLKDAVKPKNKRKKKGSSMI
ncbi:hypothetical protein V6N12_021116 [Hibiscus sabdariffa]|uniref:Exoribonuclease phosphorolytic domain-containing protein n=1 Tax=Hibiscus sabdariffa TaxID=183260 RepID=A0ABR1ZJY6_9ROSI